jgi:hypothetical protein
MGLKMATKNEIDREYAPKYRQASKREKTRILDMYLELTGRKNRKNAITRLNSFGKKRPMNIGGKSVNAVIGGKRKRAKRKKYYDEPVAKALVKLWAYFLFICAERLVVMLRDNLDSPGLLGKFPMSVEVARKLKKISVSTVKRLLKKENDKGKGKGKSTTKRGELLKNQIPVRVFWAWDDKKPGFCEIDTVSHDGGGEINSDYAWTLTVTDVCLGWVELRALKNKAQKWTDEAASDIYEAFPVPVLGIDSDGGSEFINWHFVKWCRERKITFTRGRAHYSNDNCFVEQKNGDAVRKTVGYARFEGDEPLAALREVYRYLCPLLNYFYPTKKLIGKEVLPSGRVKRIYDKDLKTPFQRLMEHEDVLDEHKTKAEQVKASWDIVELHDRFYAAREKLDKVVGNYYERVALAAAKEQPDGLNPKHNTVTR